MTFFRSDTCGWSGWSGQSGQSGLKDVTQVYAGCQELHSRTVKSP